MLSIPQSAKTFDQSTQIGEGQNQFFCYLLSVFLLLFTLFAEHFAIIPIKNIAWGKIFSVGFGRITRNL